MEDKKYYITNQEDGWPYEVDKETYDAYHNAIWSAKSFLRGLNSNIGKPVLFGTGGEMDDKNNSLKDMFCNPEKYKLIPYPEREPRYIIGYDPYIKDKENGEIE